MAFHWNAISESDDTLNRRFGRKPHYPLFSTPCFLFLLRLCDRMRCIAARLGIARSTLYRTILKPAA